MAKKDKLFFRKTEQKTQNGTGTKTKTQISGTEYRGLKINKHLQSIYLQQRRQEYTMEKRQSLQHIVLGKLDSCMWVHEIRTHPHTVQKK